MNIISIPNILKTWNNLESKFTITIQQFKDFYFKRFYYPQYWYNDNAWNEYIQSHTEECIKKSTGILNVGVSTIPNLEESLKLEKIDTSLNQILNDLNGNLSEMSTIVEITNILKTLLKVWKNINLINFTEEYSVKEENVENYERIVIHNNFERSLLGTISFLNSLKNEEYIKRKYLLTIFSMLKSGWEDTDISSLKNVSNTIIEKQNHFEASLKDIVEDLSNVRYTNESVTKKQLKDIFEQILDYENQDDNTFLTALEKITEDINKGNVENFIFNNDLKYYLTILVEGWQSMNFDTQNFSLNDSCKTMLETLNINIGKTGYHVHPENNKHVVLTAIRIPKIYAPIGLDKTYNEKIGLLEYAPTLQEFVKEYQEENEKEISIKNIDRSVLDKYLDTYWYSVEESINLAWSFIMRAVFDRVGMNIDLNIPLKNETQSTDLSTYMNTVMSISGIPEHILDPGIYTKDKVNDRSVPETVLRSINDLYKIKTTAPTYEPKEWDIIPTKGSNKPVLSSGIFNYLWKRISWFEGTHSQDTISCIRFPYQSYPYQAVLCTQGEIIHLELNQSVGGRELTKEANFKSKYLRTDDHIYVYFETTIGKFTLTVFGLDSDGIKISSLEDYPPGVVLSNIVF